MTQEQFDQYLAARFNDQRDWYNQKAAANKKNHFRVRWIIISLSAITPIFIAITQWSDLGEWQQWFSLIPIAFSAIVAIAASASEVFRYHEDWIQKRKANEKLKREQFGFETGTGIYKKASNPQELFVERVESIIEEDTNLFVQGEYQSQKKFDQEFQQLKKELKQQIKNNDE